MRVFIFDGGSDPVLAFDDNGRLYFSWISTGYVTQPAPKLRIMLSWAYSDNDGKAFRLSAGDKHILSKADIIGLGTQLGSFGNGMMDRDWLAVDRSHGPFHGSLYCVGQFIARKNDPVRSTGISLFFKRTHSDQFDQRMIRISEGSDTQWANVAVDGQGHVHVIYATNQNQTKSIVHTMSANGGVTFSKPVVVGTFEYNRDQKIIHSRANPFPYLSIDHSTNTLHVTWTSFGSNRVVTSYLSSSDDDGKSWSSPLSLTDLSEGQAKHSFMPVSIATDRGGLTLGWFELE